MAPAKYTRLERMSSYLLCLCRVMEDDSSGGNDRCRFGSESSWAKGYGVETCACSDRNLFVCESPLRTDANDDRGRRV